MGALWLSSLIPRACRTTVVVRWKLRDLRDGASDLVAYEIARDSGWSFHVHQDLHAKIWLIDRIVMLVGSSNATARGLSLVENGNKEFGVRVPAGRGDAKVIDQLTKDAVMITDELFERISQTIVRFAGSTEDPLAVWPPEIAQILMPPNEVTLLWVAECLQTDGQWLSSIGDIARQLTPSECCDLSLLGLPPEVLALQECKDQLANALKKSKMFRWLTDYIASKERHEAYFGALSAGLHNALANDPKPYRQTVKQLLSNLLGWITALEIPEIRVDSPQHSQRVTLIPGAQVTRLRN
jgi:hypothetical protein